MTGSATLAPSGGRLFAGLALAWLAVSSAAIFIVIAAPVPPLVIAASRVALTTLAWAAVAARRRAHEAPTSKSVDRATLGLVGLAGVLLALHFALWITSFSHTSVAHGAVLVATQPIFAGLMARLTGDRPGWWLYVGIAVALVGTALMASTQGSGERVTAYGDLLALVAGAASAGYLIVSRRLAPRLPLTAALLGINGVAALVLCAFALALGVSWTAEITGADVLAVVWLGLVPGFAGHGLMNWAARHVPVHSVSIVVLLEPVGAAVLAWALFQERWTGLEVAGAALLIAGAGLAQSAER